MPSVPLTSSRSFRLFAGAAVAAVLLAGCTSEGGSADALQKACVDSTASAIKLIDAADSCGAGFVEAVFTTEATATGIAGADGAAGTNGTNGLDGAGGANGLNGTDGANGLTGSAGAPGAPGAAGADGLTGANGERGPKGDAGYPGPKGEAGADGADGIAGRDGTDGTDGAIGPMGEQGVQGEQGARGARGATGTTGATGSTGATGAAGATGAQGPAGDSDLSTHFGTNVGGAQDSSSDQCVMGTLSLTASRNFGEGLVADGRLIDIADNSDLFSLLGTAFGGNGRTTFGLPDMSHVTPDKMSWMVCDKGVYPDSN